MAAATAAPSVSLDAAIGWPTNSAAWAPISWSHRSPTRCRWKLVVWTIDRATPAAYLPGSDLPKISNIFLDNKYRRLRSGSRFHGSIFMNPGGPNTARFSDCGPRHWDVGLSARAFRGYGFAKNRIDKTNPWFTWMAAGLRRCRRIAPRQSRSERPHVSVESRRTRRGHPLAAGSIFVLATPSTSMLPSTGQEHMYEPLLVTGILSTGGSEDDAVVMPSSSMQGIAGKPGSTTSCTSPRSPSRRTTSPDAILPP